MKFRFLFSTIIFISVLNLSYSSNSQDSLPILNPAYKGFRLAITDISSQQLDGFVNFQFTIINTGVEDIKLGDEATTERIILNLDEFTSKSSFKKYTAPFKQTLFSSDLNIKAGEIIYNRKLNIQNNIIASDLSASNEENIQNFELNKVQEADLSTTSAMAKGLVGDEKNNSNCSDLIIETLSIVKQSKSSITLKYKIKNQGKQPATIVGTSKSQNDNLALNFHMSSSEKLTRGAIPIGGTTIKKGKQIPDGKLYPGKSLTEEVKLDIRNMTRFTPIIIIEIDPFLSVQECSKTNNLNYVEVKQK